MENETRCKGLSVKETRVELYAEHEVHHKVDKPIVTVPALRRGHDIDPEIGCYNTVVIDAYSIDGSCKDFERNRYFGIKKWGKND